MEERLKQASQWLQLCHPFRLPSVDRVFITFHYDDGNRLQIECCEKPK